MQKILSILQREYAETVKTKTFLLSILFVPVMIGAIIFFSQRISHKKTGPEPPRKVAVTDLSGALSVEIKTLFDEYNKSHPNRQILVEILQPDENPDAPAKRQKDKLLNKELNAYIILDKEVVEGNGKIRLYLSETKISELDYISNVENLLNRAIVTQRCKLCNLSPKLLTKLRRRVLTERVEVGSAGKERVQKKSEQIIGIMTPFFFMYLMFLGIFGMGQQMLSSVIEEKNSRVIEVLLSAVSPFQLMVGKILGLAAIGLTVMSLWGIAAYITARWQGFNIEITIGLLLYFIIYYILGFLLFCSILAGIGSMCNTIKEAQNLMMPVTLLFILPMIAWLNLVRDPGGILAVALSYVPPLTPMVMILRLCASSDVAMIEIIASIVLLAVFVPVVMWLAAKVFRTGILMYGKRPGVREILHWLRSS